MTLAEANFFCMNGWTFLILISGYLLIPAMAWAKDREWRMRIERGDFK